MPIKQWVNLPKKPIFKDSDIDSVDRCGALTVEVEVDKAKKAISYKARITAVGSDNVTYNAAELARNKKFKMDKGILGIVDEKTIKIEGIRLPPAGGNKYKIEVQDAAGNIVSTPVEVKTIRKLYYQKISMQTGTDTVPSYSLTSLETDSLKHHIEIVSKGTEAKIPYYKTVMLQSNGNNLNAFGASVSGAFNIDNELKKLGMAVVYSEYLAKKGQRDFVGVVGLGTTGGTFQAQLTRTHLIVTGDRYLWHALDDTEDQNKEYFIDGVVKYTDPADASQNLTYFINRADVDIDGAAAFTHGGHHKIKISIPTGTSLETMAQKTTGIIEATLEVNVAAGWINGFSWEYSGAKLITCARRTTWTDMPIQTQDYTWIHEIGHRFGMVAYGDKNHTGNTRFTHKPFLPDAPSTLYGENRGVNDKGHSGPHCEKGATYNSSTRVWSGAPGCVMFGANGIGSNHAPKDYCSECKPIVRKLDLSD